MKAEYRYILAPNNANNFSVVQYIAGRFPELIIERRMMPLYKRDPQDVVDEEGQLLVNANEQPYIYVKIDINALTEFELDQILSSVDQVQVFTRDTQPFNQFWI